MLLPEIEPFAQAHIEQLKQIRARMQILRTTINDVAFQTMLNEWETTLVSTERALYRFQVCMIDEHQMKDRAEKKARHCRLHHQDQD